MKHQNINTTNLNTKFLREIECALMRHELISKNDIKLIRKHLFHEINNAINDLKNGLEINRIRNRMSVSISCHEKIQIECGISDIIKISSI